MTTIDISTFVPNATYQDISAAVPVLSGTPETDWTPNKFNSVKFWSGLELDDNQVVTVGETWMGHINAGTISVQTVIQGLKLAMSLKSMNPGNTTKLISQQERPAPVVAPMVEPTPIPALDQFSGTAFTLRVQQAVPVQPGAPGMPQAAVAQVEPLAAPLIPVGVDTAAEKRNSYCFIAAYLMRLLVKSPDNVTKGVKNMKERFEQFYGPARTVMAFELTLGKASAYKDAMLSQQMLVLTYTHALANTHQVRVPQLDQREVGVLSYLGFLTFSYTGMHAYTLMTELHGFAKTPMNKLLSLFSSDITNPALNTIARIIRTLERTTANADRDCTFRYATLFGPEYFLSIRSKNCVHLLYMAACAWKVLAAGHENADPEKISALNLLSTPMKRTLKRAGDIIGNSLKANMLGGVGVSPVFAMALTNERAEPEEEGQEDWENLLQ